MTDNPFTGLAPNLIPNPPGEIPEAPGAGDAVAALSPFKEALDVDEIIKNLVLDRPLKLFIPDKHKYPEWEFRIINGIPTELSDAHRKGWREVTDEKLAGLFTDLVAGTTKTGQAFRPILMSRSKKIGDIERKRNRKQLAGIYAGMDPRQKEISGKYVENVVDHKDGSRAQFSGAGWRIRY